MILNNFCVLPFNSISIDAEGNIRQCCNAGGIGYPINVNHNTIDEVLNNESNISLRESFLKNEKDPLCQRCWAIEDLGNQSFRYWANKESFGLKSIIPIKKESKIEFSDIQYLDITLGNKCNLGCRMCNPNSSSLVAKAWKIFGEWQREENIEFSRETRNKILEIIDKSVNLNTIFMLGGEPLINDFHDEIVELLIKNGRSKNIKLHYSTNLQIDLEKHLNLWSNFKNIECSISIDGTNEIYEYIRWPGRWEKVYCNFLRTLEYSKEFPNFHPSISTTMQNLNASNVYDLFQEFSIKINKDLKFFFIRVTGFNHIEIAPAHILEKEISKLETLPIPAKWHTRTPIQYLKDAVEKSKNLDPYEVKKFFIRQKKFDLLRNQNLFSTVKYLEELADQFKIEKW